MSKYSCVVAVKILAIVIILTSPLSVMAVDPAMVDRESEAALKLLYEGTPAARELAGKAKGILVFPNIVKAGFIFVRSTATGSCSRAARWRAVTTSPLSRTACRLASKRSPTPCSS
jgi:lipid-binding SYLF domain-containing protein